jgi:hypothetical protein
LVGARFFLRILDQAGGKEEDRKMIEGVNSEQDKVGVGGSRV